MALTGFLGRLGRADFADALGLYLAAGTVSLVLVRKRVNSVRVVAVESAELPAEVESRDSVFSTVTRDFIRRHGIDDARVSLAVGRHVTMFGDLQLPASAVANLDKVMLLLVGTLIQEVPMYSLMGWTGCCRCRLRTSTRRPWFAGWATATKNAR